MMTEKIERIRKLIEKRKATHDLDITDDIVGDIAEILSTMPVGTQISEIRGRKKFIHRKLNIDDSYCWLCVDVTKSHHRSDLESAYLMGLWMCDQITLLDYHEKLVI